MKPHGINKSQVSCLKSEVKSEVPETSDLRLDTFSTRLFFDGFVGGGRTEILRARRDRRGFRRPDAQLDFEILQRLLGELALHALLGLDLRDTPLRQIGGDTHLAAVLV